MSNTGWLKLSALAFSLAMISACSTFKHGQSEAAAGVGGATGAQAEGMVGEAGFADQTAANKMKVADQVYYFDFDKYELRKEDVASANVQADYLLGHASARVRLEGHADERGSREYNVALGWRRAKAVAALLQQKGIAPAQIVTLSYGKEKPFAFGHDEASYRLNRRVNLVYEAK